MDSQLCTKCKTIKPLDEFHRNKNYPKGRMGWCKLCSAEYQREWYKKNVDSLKRKNLQRRYKLSLETFRELLDSQDNKCACCGTDTPGGFGKEFNVDHDHNCCPSEFSCGKCIRGLICWRCNTVLGRLKEDESYIEKIVNYIQKHKKEEIGVS